MTQVQLIAVEPEDAETRLDRWLHRRFPALTHGRLEKLLRTGQVRVDGKRVAAGDRLAAGQTVRVPPLPDEARPAKLQQPDWAADGDAIRRLVIHRDEAVIALNKPPGLAVQGGRGVAAHIDGMLDALQFDARDRPRLVHRLDRDTSGVLLIARTAAAARALTASFESRAAHKLYWAIVVGVPEPNQGKIDLALIKTADGRGERVAADKHDGRRAVTLYRVVEHAGKKAAWMAFQPQTGRTHQLRVHAVALGHPILGDGKYGGTDAFLVGGDVAKQLHLHARRIVLPHPKGGKIDVSAPLPPVMAATWRYLGFTASDRTADALIDD